MKSPSELVIRFFTNIQEILIFLFRHLVLMFKRTIKWQKKECIEFQEIVEKRFQSSRPRWIYPRKDFSIVFKNVQIFTILEKKVPLSSHSQNHPLGRSELANSTVKVEASLTLKRCQDLLLRKLR